MTNELWPVGTWVAELRAKEIWQVTSGDDKEVWLRKFGTNGHPLHVIRSRAGFTELPLRPDVEALEREGYRLTGMAAGRRRSRHMRQPRKSTAARTMASRSQSSSSIMPLDQLPPIPENYAIPALEPAAIERNANPKAVTPAVTMREEYDERAWRIYRWIYCRLTEQVDAHIGRILDSLRLSHQEENTLVVFTSDHGNMDASHRLASKGFFYEESVAVPFLMRQKGVIAPGSVNADHLVSTGLDILPTLCDYAAVASPETSLGMSLRPVAEGKSVDRSRPFVVSENHTGRMVRSDLFKYCVYDSDTPSESLVDMTADPGEMRNLASLPEYQDALIQHRRYLSQWIEESNDEHARGFAIRG